MTHVKECVERSSVLIMISNSGVLEEWKIIIGNTLIEGPILTNN